MKRKKITNNMIKRKETMDKEKNESMYFSDPIKRINSVSVCQIFLKIQTCYHSKYCNLSCALVKSQGCTDSSAYEKGPFSIGIFVVCPFILKSQKCRNLS